MSKKSDMPSLEQAIKRKKANNSTLPSKLLHYKQQLIIISAVVIGLLGVLLLWLNKKPSSAAQFSPAEFIVGSEAGNQTGNQAGNQTEQNSLSADYALANLDADLDIEPAANAEPVVDNSQPLVKTRSVSINAATAKQQAANPPPQLTAATVDCKQQLEDIKQQLSAKQQQNQLLAQQLQEAKQNAKPKIKAAAKQTAAKKAAVKQKPQPKTKAKRQQPRTKARTYRQLIKPGFTFVGIEIWDNNPKAIIRQDNKLYALSIGEQLAGFALLTAAYPNLASFKHLASGSVINLSAKGRNFNAH